jgi:hypothetical protein
MKTMVYIALLSLAFLEGCVPFAKLSMGVCRPREETPGELITYLHKNSFPTNNLFIIKDSSTYIKMLKDSVLHQFLFTTVVFRGDFRRIENDTSRCQWSGGYMVAHLKTDSAYLVSDTYSFNDFVPMMTPLFDSIQPLQVVPGEFDFIIVNTWAKFLGKFNERLFSLSETIRERPDLKILVINLNLDMQRSWNLRKDQKITLN